MSVVGADPRAALELLGRPGVVPTRVVPGFDGPEVVLVALGPHVFREPFFDESVNAALSALRAYPERARMPLEDLVAFDAYPDAIPLAGLVFHVSRCGSTLVSRMLAQDEATHVVAEADPLDVVATRMLGDAETQAKRLRGMVRAYARRRTERTERLVLKLDAWHLCSLPLFRAALPEVPWVVVVRDPLEVLASHRRRRGSHMVPGLRPPDSFGLEPSEFEPHELDRYGCLVLRGLYEAARVGLASGHGRVIEYPSLPGAVRTEVMPFFGIRSSLDPEAEARLVAEHVKIPGAPFVPDAEEKRREVPDEIRSLVDELARPAYDALLASR